MLPTRELRAMYFGADPKLVYQHVRDERDRRFRYVALAVLAALATLWAVCGCAPLPQYRHETYASLGRTVEQQNESRVRIESVCMIGDALAEPGTLHMTGGYGSGVIISTGNVLTAAHVVTCKGALLVHVVDEHDQKFSATVAYTDPARDYARLLVPGLHAVNSAVIGHAHIGDWVCVVAAWPARARSCKELTDISWYKTVDNGVVDLWFGARLVPGNSGAGIYNAHGELLGLATNNNPCLVERWRDDCGGLGTSLIGQVQ